MKFALAFLLCLLSILVSGQKFNRDLDYSLFYSNPFRHNNHSRIKKAKIQDITQFNFIVEDTDDQLSKYYGEKTDEWDKRPILKIDSIFHPQVLLGVKNKISSDLSYLGLTNQNPTKNKIVKISTSLEVFAVFPQKSIIVWEYFGYAKVRVKIKALLNDSLIVEKKYEDYYRASGADRDFEGWPVDMHSPNKIADFAMAACLRRTLDQFYVDLFKALRVNKMPRLLVEGRVIDSLTNEGLTTNIIFNVDSAYSVISTAGNFKIKISKSRVIVVINVPGYASYRAHFDFSNSPDITGWVIRMNPKRRPIPNFNSVLFQVGTSDMIDESINKLDEVVSFLISDQKAMIQLRGYTDVRGDSEKDIELSNERVDVIKAYLIGKGISSKRINGVGFGGTMPVYSGKSENDRKLNRRVEFVITYE